MQTENPNFPDFLNIRPSHIPNDLNSHLEDAFGTHAQEEAIRLYGIAGRVWEAAYVMLLYVKPTLELEFDPPFFSPSNHTPLSAIELGSGSGIVARTIAAQLRSENDLVVATDLSQVCPLLRANLPWSKVGPVLTVRPLAWGDIQHASDISSEFFKGDRILTHVICSDLVYFPELLAPLMRTLIHLTSLPFTMASSQSPRVIISYKVRSLAKESLFWSAFGLWFEFSPILARQVGSTHWERFGSFSTEDSIFVFVAHRRPQSFKWQVPVDDGDLLNGKGAWGTDSRKADDTFESLLLMIMDE